MLVQSGQQKWPIFAHHIYGASMTEKRSVSGRWSQKERDSGEESLVGGVVYRLEPVSHGVGPSDLFDPCTPRFEMHMNLEPRKV